MFQLYFSCTQKLTFLPRTSVMTALNFLTLSNLLFLPLNTYALTALVDILKGCPNNARLVNKIVNFTFHNEQLTTIVSYYGVLNETLKAPLEIKSEGQICNFQKTQCMTAPGVSYPDLCSILTESYYGKFFFGKMEPPIKKCPVKPV